MSDSGDCPHCGEAGFKNLEQHARNCEFRFSHVYRIVARFARRRMENLGFDRRRRESGVFEYAMLRFYADRIGFWLAASVIAIRLYLWADIGAPWSGTMAFDPTRDGLIFGMALWRLASSRWALMDFKEHVVDRIERIAEAGTA